jgi:hypothetical protein
MIGKTAKDSAAGVTTAGATMRTAFGGITSGVTAAASAVKDKLGGIQGRVADAAKAAKGGGGIFGSLGALGLGYLGLAGAKKAIDFTEQLGVVTAIRLRLLECPTKT